MRLSPTISLFRVNLLRVVMPRAKQKQKCFQPRTFLSPDRFSAFPPRSLRPEFNQQILKPDKITRDLSKNKKLGGTSPLCKNAKRRTKRSALCSLTCMNLRNYAQPDAAIKRSSQRRLKRLSGLPAQTLSHVFHVGQHLKSATITKKKMDDAVAKERE